tara:strand:+ start:269 stop:571 length:303 start_codon:yes stop_codon:yes gene_type:complete
MSENNPEMWYQIAFPLYEMSQSMQEQFWVFEGRIRRHTTFDTGYGMGELVMKDGRGMCRMWELDWSLKGEMDAQDLLKVIDEKGFPFTVRMCVVDLNMRG